MLFSTINTFVALLTSMSINKIDYKRFFVFTLKNLIDLWMRISIWMYQIRRFFSNFVYLLLNICIFEKYHVIKIDVINMFEYVIHMNRLLLCTKNWIFSQWFFFSRRCWFASIRLFSKFEIFSRKKTSWCDFLNLEFEFAKENSIVKEIFEFWSNFSSFIWVDANFWVDVFKNSSFFFDDDKIFHWLFLFSISNMMLKLLLRIYIANFRQNKRFWFASFYDLQFWYW